MSQMIELGGEDEEPEAGRIRLRLDGQWTGSEFAELLGHMQFLYDVARLGQEGTLDGGFFDYPSRISRYRFYSGRYPDLEFELEQESEYVRRQVKNISRGLDGAREGELVIDEIHLASPGNLDLIGIGKLAEQARLFVDGIIDRLVAREDRAIARDAARQDVLAKKIANAEKLVGLAERVGITHEERTAVVREVLRVDNYIEGKVLEGKITDVEKLSDSYKMLE